MNTLLTTINYAQPFIQYSPLTAGVENEPAVSVASMIRNSILNPPMTWSWNRFEDSSVNTQIGVQDYTVNLTNFGFLEKVSLVDSKGNIQELKDVLNTNALAQSTQQQRPSAVSVISNTPGTSIKIRFLGVPDQVYNVILTYQAASVQFGPYSISSVASASGGNTAYTGVFNPAAFSVGTPVLIVGCTTSANNGTFSAVNCTSTILTVGNASGIAETETTAAAINTSWAPIPDYYSDIYNNLFLAEAFEAAMDSNEAARYRQRGVAAFLAKADGLTEMQRNAWTQQWLSRDAEITAKAQKTAQATQARAI